METYYYGRQSILTGHRSGYSVVSTLTEITEGVRGVVLTPENSEHLQALACAPALLAATVAV